MPEVVKCPACADEPRQELLGYIALKDQPAKPSASALHQCGACDFLYTVPKLVQRSVPLITVPQSLMAKLVQDRDGLRECAKGLERAMAECQDARRDVLETLAEVDAVIAVRQAGAD
jgi:hypothetical protein